jgi:hypothetical protein
MMMPESTTVTDQREASGPSSTAGSGLPRITTAADLFAPWEGEEPLSRPWAPASKVCGYAHPGYAESFREVGIPVPLSDSGGWLIKRHVPDGSGWDAMGCYPLFSCQNWRWLGADLNALNEQLVSVAAVLDPFGEYDQELLRDCFPDCLIAFKNHFVVDLTAGWERHLPENHQRNARKALHSLKVEVCNAPELHLDEWAGLYSNLIRRHQITGIRTFSRRAFVHQFQVPGLRMIRARLGSSVVGMLLWYVQGEIAYYHLGACSPQGYERGASFALFWTALDYFSCTPVRWLDLGAGSGTKDSSDDGLSRFKRGWANATRTAYFGGRILDRPAYRHLMGKTGRNGNRYFPAYRAGEFC